MKKISILILTGIIAIALTAVQIRIVKNAAEEEEKVEAFVYTRSFQKGDEALPSMLKSVSVPVSLVPSGYCTHKEELTDRYFTRDVYAGEIALAHDISSVNPKDTELLQKTKEENVFISIKPDPERTVAWQVEKDHKVDIFFVPYRNEEIASFRLESIRIAGIVDDGFSIPDSGSRNQQGKKPVYLILEVTVEDAEKIASSRPFGYFDVILRD
jgi:hypothetical protein